MKIGIIGTRGIPNRYGGFEQFAGILSQGLVNRGHEVAVYNSGLHEYQQSEWNGVKIIHCRDREDKLGSAGQFFYDRNCILDARKRNFDVLLHLGYTSDSVWHRLWPKKSLNIVNMDGLEWKRAKYSWLTKQFLKKAEALAARHADVLVADNPGIQEHLRKRYNKDSVYIPYPVRPVSIMPSANPSKPYYLIIARMEPENHIEMIIRGVLRSKGEAELIIVGNTANRFGKKMQYKYQDPRIRFAGAIYDQQELDKLRVNARIYFHGHSVGGTNPSLLEAMACGCRIAAHGNEFNRNVLKEEGKYFLSEDDVAGIIESEEGWELPAFDLGEYEEGKIVSAYEEILLTANKL